MPPTLSKPKLIAKIPKERDLEIHVRTQHIFGTEYVEVRDHVPSTKTDSRGFRIERGRLPQLIEALQTLLPDEAVPGEGQGRLL